MTKQCELAALPRAEQWSTQCVLLSRQSTESFNVFASSCHLSSVFSSTGGSVNLRLVAVRLSNFMPRSPRKKHWTSWAVLAQALAHPSKSHFSGWNLSQYP